MNDSPSMNIGAAAKASGVSAKMLRHYEEVGLLPKAKRSDSGYRRYTASDVHTLRFIRHARELGFSVKVIGELVSLWQNRRRPSSRVKALAEAHLRELEQKLVETLAMKATLEHLVHCCHGDDRPECPILDNLSAAVMVRPGDGSATKPRHAAVAAALTGGNRRTRA
jgi:Cu(I)-responsive transcriptional regulator